MVYVTLLIYLLQATRAPNPIKDVFKGWMHKITVGSEVQFTSESFYDVQVWIKGLRNLNESLQ